MLVYNVTMKNDDYDQKIQNAVSMAELNGIATISTDDSTIIVLNKERINELFAKNNTKKNIVIISKRPTIKDAAN